eukprot:TRINITY_DN60185_c0_g1_i1.p1 TRINITY_DN60185_c0_g1~~TRINITY_DN60185_c0_g1_i1.p1  ORF type:complete len:553 (+),score=155.51 TRINITY_DN60185_c0_g1_i1:92-1750(+)
MRAAAALAASAAAAAAAAGPAAGELFAFVGPNTTAAAGGWTGVRADAQCSWPGDVAKADFSVYPSLLAPAEVLELRDTLPAVFDADRDSVDGMPTHEFYLERNGSSARGVAEMGWKPDADEAVREERRPARDALERLLRPIIEQRIEPLVNERYPASCRGRCTCCFSLVRRYQADERTTHRMHFDIQALVTVVVSLSDYGSEYEGGIYVATGQWKRFLALRRGDAVAHQSNLLHGVRLLRGTRFSWIMWFQDSPVCDADPAEWHQAEAEAGDPVAQFIHARRAHMHRGVGSAAAERARWLRRSAEGGFARAQNELGLAYKDGDGVERDASEAEKWFSRAAAAGEPDALYNLGQLQVEAGDGERAAQLFREGAEQGSPDAMFNLGVAMTKGVGTPSGEPDAAGALRWFAESAEAGFDGSPQAMFIVHQLLAAGGGDGAEAAAWLRRAAAAGHPPAVKEYVLTLLQDGGAAAAAAWLEGEARAGAPVAQSLLGRMLHEGTHFPRDAARAVRLLRAAAAAGDDDARQLLPEVQRSRRRARHGPTGGDSRRDDREL